MTGVSDFKVPESWAATRWANLAAYEAAIRADERARVLDELEAFVRGTEGWAKHETLTKIRDMRRSTEGGDR